MPAPLLWHSAVASCANSHCEGEFVHNLATSNYWIGLSDTQTEGTFLWINGQVPVYTNWSPGEPNDDKFFFLLVKTA